MKFKKINTIFRMYEYVPEYWTVRKFGDFTKRINKKFSEKIPAPVLSMTKHRGFVKSTDYFNKQVFSNDISNYKMVKQGNFAYATIHLDEGSIGLLREFDYGYVSPMYTVFETDSTVNDDYLLLLLKTPSYLQKYASIGEGTVDRRKSVKFSDLSRLKIPLPSLPEQQKIATILSNVDNLIETTGKVIENSKKVKKGLMQKLLTRGIGHKKFKKIIWLFGKEIEIPHNWGAIELKKLLLNQNSGLHNKLEKSEDGDNIVGMYDLYNVNKIDGQIFTLSKFPKTIKNKIVKKEKYLFDENDFVYIEISLVKEGIGKTVYVTKKGKGTFFAGNVRRFKINDMEISSEFLFQYLNTNMIRNYMMRISYTSAQTGITTKDYFKVKIITPPLPEQQKIATILSNIDSKITSQEQYKEKLEKLKKSLMQKLLTGEVRV